MWHSLFSRKSTNTNTNKSKQSGNKIEINIPKNKQEQTKFLEKIMRDGFQAITREIKELHKNINHNKMELFKLQLAFKTYVNANGVPNVIKESIKSILE